MIVVGPWANGRRQSGGLVPRWILPLVVLSDVIVLGVLDAVVDWPGLLFGLPVLIGTVIALLVLRLVTAPHRRGHGPGSGGSTRRCR